MNPNLQSMQFSGGSAGDFGPGPVGGVGGGMSRPIMNPTAKLDGSQVTVQDKPASATDAFGNNRQPIGT